MYKKRNRRKRQGFRWILGALIITAGGWWAGQSGNPGSSRGLSLNLPGVMMTRRPVVQSGRSLGLADTDPDSIPDHGKKDELTLSDGMPGFTQEELDTYRGEYYSSLDGLGRCGYAMAMLDRSMMPDAERGEIGQIKPTGWVQSKYEGIIDSTPPYLYNRCHLIAYRLTGQNANEKNLITGTRYMNAEVMLPWELKVMKYLEKTNNHVLYRVTPLFRGNELLSRGVEMEAYSVEDQGRGVCFHVFVYNQQPGIEIDYRTGENRAG